MRNQHSLTVIKLKRQLSTMTAKGKTMFPFHGSPLD